MGVQAARVPGTHCVSAGWRGRGQHVAAEVTKYSWVSLRMLRKSAQGNGWLFLALSYK